MPDKKPVDEQVNEAVVKLKDDLEEVINNGFKKGKPDPESTTQIFALLTAYETDHVRASAVNDLKEIKPEPKKVIKTVKKALKTFSESPEERARRQSQDILEGRKAELGGQTQTTAAVRVDAVNQRNMGNEDARTYDVQGDYNFDAVDDLYEAEEESKEKRKREGDPDQDDPTPPLSNP